MVWARRISQTAFLLLFCWLFFQTAYHPDDHAGGGVKLFFEIDPLAMLATLLSAHAVAAGMLLSLATLALTILFGRWFCGWICPLGTLHHACSSMRGGRTKAKLEAGRYSKWQNAKYYVLAAFLAAALLGSNLAGWLDPISFLYRSLTAAVWPAVNLAPGAHLLALHPPRYCGNVLIGFLFGAALALNFYRPRFWCRFICPLGALLGIAARKPLVRMAQSGCDDCGLCLASCQGGVASKWTPAECMYCFNCREGCPKSVVSLAWSGGSAANLDLGRRQLLASAAAGAGGALLFATHPLARGRSFSAELVRPPGALREDGFLARCLRCGECMKVCPANGVHPAGLEAGLEGIWTPVMRMTIGYCEYECTLCSEVCPSGAIRPLTLSEKQKIRIGLAWIDRNRCLPYADGRACIVCEEHCPTPKKAIRFQEASVGGVVVKQPHVDLELCIGCGICVNKCVIKGHPAILVSSAGESRNSENGVLL